MSTVATTTRIPLNLYVIKTDPKASRHRGLHTNTAPHLLCRDPRPGDQILFVLSGEKWVDLDERGEIVGGSAELRCWSPSSDDARPRPVVVESHLGRAASLGEDGAEGAFGEDALPELWLELLNSADWNYAPVSASQAQGDETFRTLRAEWREGVWSGL